jgi:G3E family GTPase
MMMPICLVMGFLGTGKTTFLKNIAALNGDRKIVYLVNEFSAHDVDGAALSAENPFVVSIPDGSIFCKCRVTEFIGELNKIAAQSPDAQGVVIEASGMANPKVMEQMLTETRLGRLYRLATVISIIEPNSFLKLRNTLPNIIAQIEAADVVLVNKTDCNTSEKIEKTDALVREIHPGAERIQTIHCEAAIDLFAEHAPRGLQGEYAKCSDPNYTVFVTKQPFNGNALEEFILACADDIYRVKGTLADEFFDYSTTGIIRMPKAGKTSKLAWIVKGGKEEIITAHLRILRTQE